MQRLIELAIGLGLAALFLTVVVYFILRTAPAQPGGLILSILNLVNTFFGFGGK
jgi:hypothetical protein